MTYLTTFQLLFLFGSAGASAFLLLNALMDVYGRKLFRADRCRLD